MNSEKKISIEFHIEELNTIIEALSKEPFKKVYKIIEKLHVQSKKQLEQTTIIADN